MVQPKEHVKILAVGNHGRQAKFTRALGKGSSFQGARGSDRAKRWVLCRVGQDGMEDTELHVLVKVMRRIVYNGPARLATSTLVHRTSNCLRGISSGPNLGAVV